MSNLFQRICDRFIPNQGSALERRTSWGTVAAFMALLAIVCAGTWLIWKIPQWQVNGYLERDLSIPKRLELEDAFRKTTTQIVLGLFGLFLLYFTWRRARNGDATVRIMEQAHITDRFTKAIEQLGKTEGSGRNIEIRLGAIYALERVAFDSSRDHWTIMEILTAYVRQNTPCCDTDSSADANDKPSTEIQAILTVLGRRDASSKREPRQEYAYIDLMKTQLRGARLVDANLQGVDLEKADLRRASLFYAKLQGAALMGANLEEANLAHADLTGAFMRQANLIKANLAKANMTEVHELTAKQVKSARNWKLGRYSPALRDELGLG